MRLTVAVAGLLCMLALAAPPTARASASPYGGLAAWIDIFDAGPWDRPGKTVGRLAGRGVTTLYVQSSNYRQRRRVHRPGALGRMLRTAHRHGIQVVAWYLPGFDEPARDWRRIKAAVGFKSRGGDRFDGFALDIEATAVRDIAVRNRRMLRLSSKLRQVTGDRYPLGAIIPDPVSQRFWPRFPYRQVRERYDAILPMSYWTSQATGEAHVHRRTCRALRMIRARTRDRTVPIHVIGGIAGDASTSEVRGFARAATACRASGASLYDAPITSPEQWRQLVPIGRLRSPG